MSERTGVVYDPLRARWRLSDDLGVNYQFAAKNRKRRARPGSAAGYKTSYSPYLPRAFLRQPVHRLGEAGQRISCRWSATPLSEAALTTSVAPFFISAISALSRAAFFTHRLPPLGSRSNVSSPQSRPARPPAPSPSARSSPWPCWLRVGLVVLGVGRRRGRAARDLEAHDERHLVAHALGRAVGDEGVAGVALQARPARAFSAARAT